MLRDFFLSKNVLLILQLSCDFLHNISVQHPFYTKRTHFASVPKHTKKQEQTSNGDRKQYHYSLIFTH